MDYRSSSDKGEEDNQAARDEFFNSLSDKPIPSYSRTLQRLQELEKSSPEEPPDENAVGLPERPNKRIQEKFRLDREQIEADLNAKGDSLYRSKLQQMREQQPWGGGSGNGWGGSSSSYGQSSNPFGWGGASAAPSPSTYGGWGGNPAGAQESPFGRSNTQSRRQLAQEEEEQTNDTEEDFYQSSSRYSQALDGDFKDLEDDNANDKDELQDDDSDEDEDYDGFINKSKNQGFKAQQSAEDTGEFSDQDSEEIPAAKDEFGQGPLSSRPRDPFMSSFGGSTSEGVDDTLYEQGMTRMQGSEMTAEGTAVQQSEVGGAVTDPNAERPRRQLKEKFMRDREQIEASLNAQGDSMYRRAGDPPPPAMPPSDAPPGYTPLGGGRRVLMPHELRAQMALQKIAKAAMRLASSKKGRKRGRTRVVFI